MDEEWGPGEAAKTAKPFDRVMVGESLVDLVWGEHPHSRRDDRCYARWPDGRIEAFDGHRVHVEVVARTYNYLKQSGLSGNEVRRGGECLIKFDGHAVYGFFFREIEPALIRAHRIVAELREHPSELWRIGREDDGFHLIGRRVYYRETPAVIEHFFGDQGAVVMRSVVGGFPRPVWRDADEFDEVEDRAKDDVLSPHIWWFRDRLVPGETPTPEAP